MLKTAEIIDMKVASHWFLCFQQLVGYVRDCPSCPSNVHGDVVKMHRYITTFDTPSMIKTSFQNAKNQADSLEDSMSSALSNRDLSTIVAYAKGILGENDTYKKYTDNFMHALESMSPVEVAEIWERIDTLRSILQGSA